MSSKNEETVHDQCILSIYKRLIYNDIHKKPISKFGENEDFGKGNECK